MTSKKFLEAAPGTGYGLVKVLVEEGPRGSDRRKKQSQALTQAKVTELPAEEKDGKENRERAQPWTEVVASGRDRHVNRLINLPGTVTVEVGRGHSYPRMTVQSVFPKVTPKGGCLSHPSLTTVGVCPYMRTLRNTRLWP